jgi:hypothetical protein
MSVELRTDMLHPGRMLGFFTSDWTSASPGWLRLRRSTAWIGKALGGLKYQPETLPHTDIPDAVICSDNTKFSP